MIVLLIFTGLRMVFYETNQVWDKAVESACGIMFCFTELFIKDSVDLYFEKAEKIALRNLGDGHYLLAKCYNLKADHFSELRYNHKAYPYFKKALSILIPLKKSREVLTEVVESYRGIGVVKRHEGNHPEAMKFFMKAISLSGQHLWH